MRQRILHLCITISVAFVLTPEASGQEPFYKGKTIRVIVGASAGGGCDTYSRTIARHMGKHIPGNPTLIVENMPGAGFLISANYIYKVAKPDGLTIGHFIGGLFLQQFLSLRPGIEFDSRKFEFIGVPTQDNYALGISRATGITGMQQWLASKTPLKLGGVGPGSATDDIPKVLSATVGLTARPYVLPPGTPQDRVEMLRKAFMDTMKDPEFLAESNKAKLDINPLHGAELERNVKEVFNLDPVFVPKVKEILK